MTYITLVAPIYYNVKQYGALGDGSTDDTTAIQNAINAANTAGGGTVFFPLGTYIVTGLTLYSFVRLLGAGVTASTIKLKNASNADVIQGSSASTLISFFGTNGTGNTGGIVNWCLEHLTIDGNKANQTAASYGLRVYGYGGKIQNVVIKNAYSDGWLNDWNGGGTAGNDSMEMQVLNLKVHDCGGRGIAFGGPHDSQFANVVVFKTAYHGIHIGPNASALLWDQAHCWGMTYGNKAVGWLIECSNGEYNGCVAEGSDTCQVVLNAGQVLWTGGNIYGSGSTATGYTCTGMQIGQVAGANAYPYSAYQTTPGTVSPAAGAATVVYSGGNLISSEINNCYGTGGGIYFANDGGNNNVNAVFYFDSGIASTYSLTASAANCFTGSPTQNSQISLSIKGLTADGTQGKGGFTRVGNNSTQAFTVTNGSNDVLNVNAYNSKVELVNGQLFHLYSDAYSTETWSVNGADATGTVSWRAGAAKLNAPVAATALIAANGAFAWGQSAASAAVATSGTITTSGIGMARVTPASSVTGVILQAGTTAGQMVIVVNESTANSVTFAASGTSNVALGTGVVIAAKGKLLLVWDSSTSLWY